MLLHIKKKKKKMAHPGGLFPNITSNGFELFEPSCSHTKKTGAPWGSAKSTPDITSDAFELFEPSCLWGGHVRWGHGISGVVFLGWCFWGCNAMSLCNTWTQLLASSCCSKIFSSQSA